MEPFARIRVSVVLLPGYWTRWKPQPSIDLPAGLELRTEPFRKLIDMPIKLIQREGTMYGEVFPPETVISVHSNKLHISPVTFGNSVSLNGCATLNTYMKVFMHNHNPWGGINPSRAQFPARSSSGISSRKRD